MAGIAAERTGRALLAAALLVSGACEAGGVRSLATRDTLANGTVTVRYAQIPVRKEDTIVPDLRIGNAEGAGPDVFGEVRGIEAGADGTIYVLDYQAAEVRAFGPDGTHLSTLARRGGGPAELDEPNGMVLGTDGTLWVQDHGHRILLGLSPQGEEVGREPMIVSGYGYIWNARIDRSGRFWQTWSHSETAPIAPGDRTSGLSEGSGRMFYKSYDPANEAYDSTFLGRAQYRSFVIARETGYTMRAVPFSPAMMITIDGEANIWLAHSAEYRIARIDGATGDTTLIIDVDMTGPAVSEQDRAAQLETLDSYQGLSNAVRADFERLIPENKPVLAQLLVDDVGRLWVGRTVDSAEPAFYDVFDTDGEYLGSVRMPPDMVGYFPPVIRAGRIYALTTDDLDVPFVVRANAPAF